MPSLIEIAKRQLTLTTHHLHTMPVLILMPHSRCNCRCVMCDIWKAHRNGSEIAPELLDAHLDDVARLDVQWVVLSGGEALMHRNLWALCERLKRLDIKITLLSTGLLLSRHAENIVRWTDETIVSLDGSRAVHDAIRRVPRAFDRLAEGVAALRDQDPTYPVSGRCVLQQQNFRDLPQIIEAAHAIGLDSISFLAADVSTDAFNRAQLWEDERVAEIALSPNEVADFERIMEATIVRYAADFAAGYIAESPDKLRRLVAYYAALNGHGDFPAVRCNAPWVSAVVEADGTVRPCFFHAPLGNINDQPLGEILNGEAGRAFRRTLDVATDAICRKCVCTLQLGPRAVVG
ncbi:MAG: radical SAM protein [Anaerolineales bacterium]|nr:radical SAM protein [Anaerolineales bacterium]